MSDILFSCEITLPTFRELWTDDALRSRPEWDEVRRQARRILQLLDWPIEGKDDPGVKMVKAPPVDQARLSGSAYFVGIGFMGTFTACAATQERLLRARLFRVYWFRGERLLRARLFCGDRSYGNAYCVRGSFTYRDGSPAEFLNLCSKGNLLRGANIGLEHLVHLLQRVVVLLLRIRRNAIRRHHQMQVPHVGVVGSE